ncbi:MAG: YCF48-related protein [Candidatus Poribacteria bacterium]|nr:YCF48-related protein [Candidatus Poribacteria bacterium]
MLNRNYQWLLFCFSLVLQLAETGVCAQRWEVINQMTGSHWHDIYFADEQNGWMVGWSPSKILHSVDGGVTWKEQFRFPKRFQRPLAVQFVDKSHGWVVGLSGEEDKEGLVYRTTDGGEHWKKQNGPPGFLDEAHFLDEKEGWIVGLMKAKDPGVFKFRAAIAHTSDGGIIWQKQWEETNPLEGMSWLNTVFFVNHQQGWAAGIGKFILSTQDGGVSWKKTPLPLERGARILKAFFLNEETGWAVGSSDGSLILHTADGGKNWRIQYANQRDKAAYNLYVRNCHELWVTGETYIDNHSRLSGGFVLHTTDGGESWKRQELADAVRSIHFITPEKGFLVGLHNVLLQTTDGGQTWIYQQERGYRLTAVTFRPSGKGWMVANSDQHPKFATGMTQILQTPDAGRTWAVISEFPTSASQGVFFHNNQRGLAVGWEINKTEDGGNTWSLQQRPEPGTRVWLPDAGREDRPGGLLRGIDFATETQGIIVGEVGRIYLTRDGGTTWEMLRKKTDVDLYDVQFLNDKIGFIAGGYFGEGVILHSNNGGRSWDIIANLENSVHALQMLDEQMGWAVGRAGYIWHTQNGGRNWKIQTRLPKEETLFDVLFLDSKKGWAVGEAGRIVATSDGGRTWRRQNSSTNVDLIKIAYNQQDALIAIGDWNTILGYQDPAFLRYAPLSADAAGKRLTQWGHVKSQLYQNFPNPFNPETWIPYQLAMTDEVTVFIYDAQGQQVRQLELGIQSAGTHLTKEGSIYWDGENERGEMVASGLYFYRLSTGEFTATRRMLMVK